MAFLHWARRVEYMVPLFLGMIARYNSSHMNAVASSAYKKRGDLEFFLKVVMIVIFLVFIYGVGQKHFNWPVIITQNEQYAKGIALRHVPGAHLTSTFAGHYDLASYLVLILPIFITVFFLIKDKKERFFIFSIVLMGLWLLSNSLSRISVVSYLIGTVLSLFLIRRYRMIPVVILISLIVFGFSSDLLNRYSRIFQVTKEKIRKEVQVPSFVLAAQETNPFPKRRKDVIRKQVSSPSVFEDRSTSIRLNVEWPRAIRVFAKNPLLGTGYSSITLATDNDYLRLLGEVGILGFLSFFLILARVLIPFLKSFPFLKKLKGSELGFIAGLSGGIVAILLNAIFIDVFEASKLAINFWLLVGLALPLVRKGLYEENN
jgi:O-antigen ligase